MNPDDYDWFDCGETLAGVNIERCDELGVLRLQTPLTEPDAVYVDATDLEACENALGAIDQ